jgi:hypothetical protein
MRELVILKITVGDLRNLMQAALLMTHAGTPRYMQRGYSHTPRRFFG